MSNVITAPFPVTATLDGRWSVNLDGRIVTVQTMNEAKLLASLPVEESKTYSDSLVKPDPIAAKAILEVCDRYGYNAVASRHLAHWLDTHCN